MRKYNLPDSDSAVSDNSLRLESDDIEIADSRADIRMNGSGSNIPPKTADRMVTRSYKKKQLMTAKKIGIGSLPDSDHRVQNEEGSNTEITVSAESSHVGRQSWSGVTNSQYKGLGEGGSIGIMALDTCKKVGCWLLVGYSIFATLVIIILGACLGMRSDQSMFTEAGTDGSGKAPMLSSENLNLGLVSWSNIDERVDEEEVCQCPEAGAGAGGQCQEEPSLWGIYEYSTMATLGILTALAIILVSLHCGKLILKDIKSKSEIRYQIKVQRMEEKLDRIKKKRAESVVQMEIAAQPIAQGFEVS